MRVQMMCHPSAPSTSPGKTQISPLETGGPLSTLAPSSPTFQDHLLARLLQCLHRLIVCCLRKVGPVDGEDGVPHIQRLGLIRCQPLKYLGDQDGHFILSATLKQKRNEAVVAVGAHGGAGGEGDARVPASPSEAEPFSQHSATPCRHSLLPHFLGCPWHARNNHSSQNTMRLYSRQR